jgi:hypothetical protein
MSDNSAKFEQIINSPINKSKAKQTYSFSKGNRFDEIRDRGSKTFTYEIPSMKNIRTTSMGFGNKIDFVLKHINKKTPFYDMPSEFNSNKPTSPAFSFGIGRKFYEKVFNC